jgi:hypothetical protein
MVQFADGCEEKDGEEPRTSVRRPNRDRRAIQRHAGLAQRRLRAKATLVRRASGKALALIRWDFAGAWSGDRFIVARSGEAYDAPESQPKLKSQLKYPNLGSPIRGLEQTSFFTRTKGRRRSSAVLALMCVVAAPSPLASQEKSADPANAAAAPPASSADMRRHLDDSSA